MPVREYTTAIRATLRASLCPSRRKSTGKRGKRCKPTSLCQAKLNQKNREHYLADTVNLNFTKRDYYLRLSYDDTNLPPTIEVAEKIYLKNYFRRINYLRKKRGLSKLRYIYFTERSDKGRIHHHIFIDGDMSRDEYEDMWKFGYTRALRLQPGADGMLGISKYSSKKRRKKLEAEQFDQKQSRDFKCSLGLPRPKKGKEIHQNDYRIKQSELAYIDEHPDDLRFIERLYPGYCVYQVETTPRDMRSPEQATPIPHAHFVTIYLYRKDAEFLKDRRVIHAWQQSISAKRE